MSERDQREIETGALFNSLFSAYDDQAFRRSVSLFQARFEDAGFDTSWFEGKTCLDAGCGGGRYSIALASLGAERVVGVDLSEGLIADARRRSAELQTSHVTFEVASVADLPFESSSFDFICHSGVLQHTADPVRVVGELARVLKPGGLIYMLVYATEGLRWPLVQMLRPVAQRIGFAAMDAAIAAAGLDVHRRRTYLDDLFVPYIDFYSWPSLKGMLEQAGFKAISRWDRGRLDHEEGLAAYQLDLKGFAELFRAVELHGAAECRQLAQRAAVIVDAVLEHAGALQELVKRGSMSEADGRRAMIGQGHHRLIASK